MLLGIFFLPFLPSRVVCLKTLICILPSIHLEALEMTHFSSRMIHNARLYVMRRKPLTQSFPFYVKLKAS